VIYQLGAPGESGDARQSRVASGLGVGILF